MPTYKYLSDDGVKYIFAKIKEAQNTALTAVANLKSASMQTVQTLPTGDNIETNVIYLVPSNPVNGTGDAYDEYVYVKTGSNPDTYAWEKIGHTDIDLSSYATQTYVMSYFGTNDSYLTPEYPYEASISKTKIATAHGAHGADMYIPNATTTQAGIVQLGTSSGQAAEGDKVHLKSASVLPSTNNTLNLGGSSNGFLKAWVREIQPAGDNNLTFVTGDDYFNFQGGKIRLGEATGSGSAWIYATLSAEDLTTSQTFKFPTSGGTLATLEAINTLSTAYTKSELDTLWTNAPTGVSNMSF